MIMTYIHYVLCIVYNTYFKISPETEIKMCETVLDRFQRKIANTPLASNQHFYPLGVGYFFFLFCVK